MMLDLATGKQEEFTQGKVDSVPKFAPDGATLGFLRPDEKDRRQVWLMAAAGGEARQLTAMERGVLDFGWSPDARQLVICADVDPEKPPEDPPAAGPPEVRVVRRIRYRDDTLGWRGDAHFHLFIAPVDGGPPRQLTDGDWDDVAPVWSPDGSRLAFISGRRDDRDRRALTEAYVVPADGGEPEKWSGALFSVAAVAWSPDGQRLATIGSDAPEGMVVWQSWLYVLERGRPPRCLTTDSVKPYSGFAPISRPPELRWTEDGRVIFLGDRRGESFLFQAPESGGPCRPISGGGCQSTSLTLDQAAGAAVTLSSSPSDPGDLYRVDLASRVANRLTDCNRDYLRMHTPAKLEKFSVRRQDLELECRLWRPPDFDSKAQYPLVLDIHGGPNGAFYDSFSPVQQLLATSGYLVLAVNPRGSSTYGNKFMMAVLGDWGGEDYQDLMSALDEVAARPYVDATRLGVHGYSYGGFMTSWAVGHTKRFRAAVVGAPCTDLYSMCGTSDIGVSFGEVQWGGPLTAATSALANHSPLTYAANVDTPVLLLHGEADVRCPIAQSEEYFVALKRLGKQVEFVRFPDCTHLFPRLGHPKMREEYLSRTLEWFNRWLG
jgi:dipeptidyl aminopeptidase/acylaminoacyl peptidase